MIPEIPPNSAVLISLGILTVLSSIAWLFAPKTKDVNDYKEKAMIKVISKMAGLEFRFYRDLNDYFTPPMPGYLGDSDRGARYEIPKFAEEYVEDRNSQQSRSMDIISSVRLIGRYKNWQVITVVGYVAIMVIVLAYKFSGQSNSWIYYASCILPLIVSVYCWFRQEKLVKVLNE